MITAKNGLEEIKKIILEVKESNDILWKATKISELMPMKKDFETIIPNQMISNIQKLKIPLTTCKNLESELKIKFPNLEKNEKASLQMFEGINN